MLYVTLAGAVLVLAVLELVLLGMLYRTDERWHERMARVLDINASEREMLLERIQAPERVVAPATDENDDAPAIDFDDDDDYWSHREAREARMRSLTVGSD